MRAQQPPPFQARTNTTDLIASRDRSHAKLCPRQTREAVVPAAGYQLGGVSEPGRLSRSIAAKPRQVFAETQPVPERTYVQNSVTWNDLCSAGHARDSGFTDTSVLSVSPEPTSKTNPG